MHINPYIFETTMLICFGLAWPTAIVKSYRARKNGSKSVYFLYIIIFGYINGIIFQRLITSSEHYVLYFFYANIALVAIDIGLYYRNMFLEKKAKENCTCNKEIL